MKKKMLLLAELDAESLKALEKHYDIARHPRWEENAISEAELADILVETGPEALVVEAQPLTAAVLEKAKSVRLITSVRTTPANIDLECCRRLGILVSTAPGRNAVAVVEMTIAFMIDVARMIPQSYYDIKRRGITLPAGVPPRDNDKDVIWVHPHIKNPPYMKYKGVEITGKTLGLFGFGAIGRMLVPKAKAFDMKVAIYDPYVDEAAAKAAGVEKCELDDMLARADFVSLHAKVTPETKHVMNMERFKKMKRSAYLVNTARGGLVKEADLIKALREKVIAGAAIDVYENEPLYGDYELIDLDNLVMTPHIGGSTHDVVRHQSELVEANALAYAEGKPLPNRAK